MKVHVSEKEKAIAMPSRSSYKGEGKIRSEGVHIHIHHACTILIYLYDVLSLWIRPLILQQVYRKHVSTHSPSNSTSALHKRGSEGYVFGKVHTNERLRDITMKGVRPWIHSFKKIISKPQFGS
jgi:hypothetical protein